MPHATIDNKLFPAYLDRQARSYAARRSVRGAYRSRGDKAVAPWLVKPKKTIRYPTKGVMVTAAVIKGRIRMMHVIQGRWNATKAKEMYEGPLLKAMAKAYPTHAVKKGAKWTVMEDNDPAGYKASSVVRCKSKLGVQVLALPPRSPDLNVLDFCLWAEINRCLRKQEAAFPNSKKETMAQFTARLRRTALRLPEPLVTKAVISMKRRVKEL
eukprot:1767985-Karenia_brevis.AAC.1